jgi:hypothetical protein
MDSYWAEIQFCDSKDATEPVPVAHIKDFNPKDFDPSKTYKVFYHPEHHSLEEVRKTLSEIPVFDKGEGSATELGYYDAKVVVVAGMVFKISYFNALIFFNIYKNYFKLSKFCTLNFMKRKVILLQIVQTSSFRPSS